MSAILYSFNYNGKYFSNFTEEDALSVGVPQSTIDQCKTAAAIQALAARRYQAETAGTNWNGHLVATDRQSQAMIMGALLATMQNSATTVDWKMADGTFVTLTATDVAALASAVRAHVQAAFDNEKALVPHVQADINADISTGWPS